MTPTPDIHTLTGAYAVDALPADERAAFESHLEVCDACAQEVAELQATAARLGESSFTLPSPDLRARVLAEIDRTRQEPPSGGEERTDLSPVRRAVPRWVSAGLLPAAASLVLVVIGLGVVVNDLNQRLGRMESASSQMTQVLAAPDAVTISADGPGGSFVRVVAAPTRGEAVFIVNDMEPAPHEHTYELWVIGDAGATPAGLFDVDERGHATRVLTGDLVGAVAIGVTVEPAGGSPQPTTDPVMVLELD
jgi:anti-sigma-K factor RskA